MNFKPYRDYAYDEISGIKIPYPRMLPEERKDGSIGVEYQYTFLRNDERIGSIGISGTKEVTGKGADRKEIFTLKIANKSAFERILQLKLISGNGETEFKFIGKIAKGLVIVFAASKGILFTQQYKAITTRKALDRNGISIPLDIHTPTKGAITLAELNMPTNLDPNMNP